MSAPTRSRQPLESEPREGSAFADAVRRVRGGADASEEAARLVEQLDEPERLDVLTGAVPFWEGRASIMHEGYNHFPYPAGRNERLGIPGIAFIDGPRGVVVGNATAFPVSMARGATWDDALEEEIGTAIGRELRASKGNFFGGVCINLPRHPAWGRIQETYSDQTVLLGRMGAALVRGVQPNAMPCVKHFALNSMENARFDVDVLCDEATLHEDFLPHFKTAIDAGADSVMCAYNSINGHWASENRELLTDVLREDWGFDGFVVSDFIWAIRDAAASLEAGLDLETPFAQLRAQNLPAALAEGTATAAAVARSAERIVRAQLDYYARRDAAEPDTSVIASPAHRALARRAARESMVLLRNRPEGAEKVPVLPLDRADLSSLAVIGRIADVENLGDHGSSNVHASESLTPAAGLREALPDSEVRVDDGSDIERAARLAADSDAAVVVVGYTFAEEGEWVNGRVYARDDLMGLYPTPKTDEERAVLTDMLNRLEAAKGKAEAGGDRASLGLPESDVELIRAVAAANPRTVVVVVAAGAVLMADWIDLPAAVVMGWYSGMEGGRALADLLLGDADFTGRMPYAIPASADDLPAFDRDAHEVVYDRWYGQRGIVAKGATALVPLGFGLSYATTAIASAHGFLRDATRATLAVDVENASDRATRAVVQVYGTRLDGERAGERELLGYASLSLEPLETRGATVDLDLSPLAHWDSQIRALVLDPGRIRLEAARYWGDPDAIVLDIDL